MLPVVGVEDIEAIVSAWTSIPVERMSEDEKDKLLNMVGRGGGRGRAWRASMRRVASWGHGEWGGAGTGRQGPRVHRTWLREGATLRPWLRHNQRLAA